MSLNSFFENLDSDVKFDAWKNSIVRKLHSLKDFIPSNEEQTLLYIEETINLIENLVHLSNAYAVHYPDQTNKKLIIERLKKCNSFYIKFGK